MFVLAIELHVLLDSRLLLFSDRFTNPLIAFTWIFGWLDGVARRTCRHAQHVVLDVQGTGDTDDTAAAERRDSQDGQK